MQIPLNLKKLSPLLGEEIPLPYYATPGAAGMDLHACMDAPVTLAPGERALVPTGFAIALPSADYAAFLFARSGLSTREGVALANGVGVVDSDYRGEVCVGLVNLSRDAYTVRPGDRIAQLVVLPVVRAALCVAAELEASVRGTGGFGSTGD